MRRRWLRRQFRRKVLVHTRDNQTLEGVLEADAPDGLVLRAARFLEGDGQVPLAGEIFVPRENVAWLQRI